MTLPSPFVTLSQARQRATELENQGDDYTAYVIRFLCKYIEEDARRTRKVIATLISL